MINLAEQALRRINKQIEEASIETEEDLQAFLDKLNSGLLDNSSTNLTKEDKAFAEYEIGCELMRSDDSDDEKEAIKHLKKAIKLNPPFFDAQAELLETITNSRVYLTELKKLEEQAEPECLRLAEVTKDEAYGDAWGHLEMRPLLRIKHRLAMTYLHEGMYRLATEKLEDILAWNEDDNQGCRMLLMGLYAYFEDESKAIELYDCYAQEKNAWNYLSLAALYYKLNNSTQSLSFIKKLIRLIPQTCEFFYHSIHDGDFERETDEDYYRPGSIEELQIAMESLHFLVSSSLSFFLYLTSYCLEHYEKQPARKSAAKPKPKAKKKR